MSAEVVQVISAYCELISQFTLEADIHLLHHRVLHLIVDDIDATGASSRKDKTAKGILNIRCKRRKHAGVLIEKKGIAGAYFNGQRPPVQPAFKRLNLNRNAVVVNPITAMQACVSIFGRPIKANPRGEIIFIALTFATEEGQD